MRLGENYGIPAGPQSDPQQTTGINIPVIGDIIGGLGGTCSSACFWGHLFDAGARDECLKGCPPESTQYGPTPGATTGIDTNTMLLIGAGILGAVLLFRK